MNITLVKTTLQFSPAFHLCLKRHAEAAGKPMSAVVEETITDALATEEQARLRAMYDGLLALDGTIKTISPRASENVDEVVYGDVTAQHV